MNTNVYENTDSETITPLNKRRILPVFLLVGLYAASTAAVMSVLPFYIREMGGSPLTPVNPLILLSKHWQASPVIRIPS